MAVERAVGAFLGARKSGSGVAAKPSSVAVTRFARRASRIVACRAARSSSRKAGGTYIGVAPGWPGTCPNWLHKERPVFRVVGPVCRHGIGRIRTGAGHAAVCEAIKNQIASGLLGPGARRLHPVPGGGVGRLADDGDGGLRATDRGGYLETRQGARARVAPGLALRRRHRGAARSFGSSGPAVQPTASAWPTSCRPGPAGTGSRGLPLRRPGGRRLPVAWRKAVTGALLRRRQRLRYGDPRGSPDLRTALQGYLWRARGLRCEPDQIVVVNGSQQGIDLCARLLLDPGTGS